jgi:hypothetical protein
VSERPDPRHRAADPAGTRPKVDPAALTPSGDFLSLPVGDAQSGEDARQLPEQLPAPSPPALNNSHTAAGHAPRIRLVFGALAALGAAAIAVAVALASAPPSKPAPPWSSWKPSGHADPAAQIAVHVEALYALSPGRRLVGVSGGPQAVSGQPVVLALRTSGSAPAPLGENGVFYELCGDGPNCSIPGKASKERAMLVTREALELALYTFRYIGGASQVVVTYPPLPPGTPTSAGKGAKITEEAPGGSAPGGTTASGSTSAKSPPSHVLLFRPSDLSRELSRPLEETLSQTTPTVKTIAGAPETALVGRLTVNLLYDSVLIPQAQGNPVLLLERPSIGG